MFKKNLLACVIAAAIVAPTISFAQPANIQGYYGKKVVTLHDQPEYAPDWVTKLGNPPADQLIAGAPKDLVLEKLGYIKGEEGAFLPTALVQGPHKVNWIYLFPEDAARAEQVFEAIGASIHGGSYKPYSAFRYVVVYDDKIAKAYLVTLPEAAGFNKSTQTKWYRGVGTEQEAKFWTEQLKQLPAAIRANIQVQAGKYNDQSLDNALEGSGLTLQSRVVLNAIGGDESDKK